MQIHAFCDMHKARIVILDYVHFICLDSALVKLWNLETGVRLSNSAAPCYPSSLSPKIVLLVFFAEIYLLKVCTVKLALNFLLLDYGAKGYHLLRHSLACPPAVH